MDSRRARVKRVRYANWLELNERLDRFPFGLAFSVGIAFSSSVGVSFSSSSSFGCGCARLSSSGHKSQASIASIASRQASARLSLADSRFVTRLAAALKVNLNWTGSGSELLALEPT